MNNETKIGISFDNVVKGSTELEKYAERLNTIKAALSGMDKGTLQAVKSSSKDVKDISGHTKNIDRNLGLAFNYTAMRTAARMISGIGRAMRTLTEQSSGYLEDFNLFQVAFNGNYQSAEKFVNKLSEMYGLDEDWLIRTTGLFKQMSNSMGLASDEGEKLSKLLTQMSIDISSLYNVDVNKASQVLQSSLAGQTKPIRGLTGGDITQATLQTTLDKIDTGKAVKDLDYAEKRLLIIISLTDQLSESAGDWGRTLESPANQTRILEEQWARLTRAVGNLFLPTLAKVLPYLNAILMVITEIINSIASLFGYDLEDYDYFDSSISSAYDFDDALGTVGDSIDKVKKKMSGLRGFDKLNNMTTPSQTNSGGSGSVGGGGINPNIMKAFNKAYDDYLKKLDETKMKATEIRDKIMDWLGFAKEIDPVTGKTVFKLRDGVQRIHLIAAAIGILVGLKLIKRIGNLIAGTSRLNKLLGIGGLAGAGKEAAEKMATFNKVIGKIQRAFAGLGIVIIGTLASYKSAYEAQKKYAKGTKNITKETGLFAGSLATTAAGGALLGSAFGKWGIIIGGAAGALVGLASGLKAAHDATIDAKLDKLFGDITISTDQWSEALNRSGVTLTSIKPTYDTLKSSITDLDTQFNEGYQTLGRYAFQFGALGQQVSKDDLPKMQKALEQTSNSAKSIVMKNTEYLTNGITDFFKNTSSLSATEQAQILKNITENGQQQITTIDGHQNAINEILNNAVNEHRQLTDEEYKNMVEHLAAMKQLETGEVSSTCSELEYLQSTFNDNIGNLNTESYDNWIKARDQYEKEQKKIIQENYDTQHTMLDTLKNKNLITADEYNKSIKDLNNKRKEDEKNLQTTLDGYNNQMAANLLSKFGDVSKGSDKASKEVRKKLEDMLKNLNINTDSLISQLESAGNTGGDKLASSLFSTFTTKVNGHKVKVTTLADGTVSFKGYATGGFPPVGQMFIAGEKGAELVGSVGGKTFVANQNQMGDFLSKNFGGNGGSKQSATFNIYLDHNHKLGSYVLEDLTDKAIANGKPITIGA